MTNLTRYSITSRFAAALILVMLLATCPAAQESDGTKAGISAVVQSGQLELMFPVWANQRWVIEPALGVAYESNDVTIVTGGFMLRYNLSTGDAVPYLGAMVGLLHEKAESDYEGRTDVLLGPTFGGEYFLKDRFSISVEGEINVIVEGNQHVEYFDYYYDFPYYIVRQGHTLVSTSTSVMVTFYF